MRLAREALPLNACPANKAMKFVREEAAAQYLLSALQNSIVMGSNAMSVMKVAQSARELWTQTALLVPLAMRSAMETNVAKSVPQSNFKKGLPVSLAT